MSALEIMQNLLIDDIPGPFTADNGGSSVGDPNAGLNSSSANVLENNLSITHKDRVGAAIITAIVLGVMIGGSVWMVF